MSKNETDIIDTIVIGSGFGGTMTAHSLIQAGERVLMLERGPWITRGPENSVPEAWAEKSPCYSTATPYRVAEGGGGRAVGGYHCVGGPSILYAGVSLRMREADFESDPNIVGDSSAEWPFNYDELEPYYSQAEAILGVAGCDDGDPTAPWRSASYLHGPGELAPAARMIDSAARSLGLHPFRLPLAINYRESPQRRACVGCSTCDGFACAIMAKNDLAVHVLPGLIRRGLMLKPNTVAVRLTCQGGAIVAVDCVDTETGQAVRYHAKRFVLSAGTLASPHLLLSSGLQRFNPAGDRIGRYLMRHRNLLVAGWFPRDPNPTRQFHKQIGINDYYFGHPTIAQPEGKLGCIQSWGFPPSDSMRAYLPNWLGPVAAPFLKNMTGLLAIAEDQPQYPNRVSLDRRTSDQWGRPTLVISHHYSQRDLAAGHMLAQKAKQILHRAGAAVCSAIPINTFTHAVGTVRMGLDPYTSPLDPYCQFRGVENLFVVDGSCWPTSAGVNPSLTIAAIALRVADFMIANPPQQAAWPMRVPRRQETCVLA